MQGRRRNWKSPRPGGTGYYPCGPDAMRARAKCWALLVPAAFAAATGLSQSGAGTVSPPRYAPAYYTGTQAEPTQLVVFPPGRPQVVIPLPVPSLLRSSVFAPDGKAIFATINTIKSPRTPGHPALLGPPRLLRIDLSPVRVTTVADLVGLEDVFGLVMTLALAFLSYHFFEFPMLRLKDRFTSGNAARVLAANSSDTSEIAANVLQPHSE